MKVDRADEMSLVERVAAYRRVVRGARLFSRYEEYAHLRADEVNEQYLEEFLRDFEWGVAEVAFTYKGARFLRMKWPHRAILEYSLEKSRFYQLTKSLITEYRDVSEAVILGYKFLHTDQPLLRWDKRLVDEDEVIRFLQGYDGFVRVVPGQAVLSRGSLRRFVPAVTEEFGMMATPAMLRQYARLLRDQEKGGDGLQIA